MPQIFGALVFSHRLGGERPSGAIRAADIRRSIIGAGRIRRLAEDVHFQDDLATLLNEPALDRRRIGGVLGWGNDRTVPSLGIR